MRAGKWVQRRILVWEGVGQLSFLAAPHWLRPSHVAWSRCKGFWEGSCGLRGAEPSGPLRVCIYGHGCMLAVGSSVSVSGCIVNRCLCGCGSRNPGLWPHCRSSPRGCGAGEAKRKRMWDLSVCLSFSPGNENPPNLRAVQLSAHYLLSPGPPAGTLFSRAQGRHRSPWPQLPGNRPSAPEDGC